VKLGFSFADMPVGISDTTVTGAGGQPFGRYGHRSCGQVDSSDLPFGASRHPPLEPGRLFHRMEHRVDLRPMPLRACQSDNATVRPRRVDCQKTVESWGFSKLARLEYSSVRENSIMFG
jgi:hypothetical protein